MVKKKTKKNTWITFYEKGDRYMICQSCQSEYVKVDENIVAVTCGRCVTIKQMKLFPNTIPKDWKKPLTGRPSGWHFMKEFVDKDGNVFHKGKEQPQLKGTLPPTKSKPKKQRKKLTADQKMAKLAKLHKTKLKAKRRS
tara:strand:- start:173 stop:589 length:417 start_codon:yes stop_codon:yes gene_type:complete